MTFCFLYLSPRRQLLSLDTFASSSAPALLSPYYSLSKAILSPFSSLLKAILSPGENTLMGKTEAQDLAAQETSPPESLDPRFRV